MASTNLTSMPRGQYYIYITGVKDLTPFSSVDTLAEDMGLFEFWRLFCWLDRELLWDDGVGKLSPGIGPKAAKWGFANNPLIPKCERFKPPSLELLPLLLGPFEFSFGEARPLLTPGICSVCCNPCRLGRFCRFCKFWRLCRWLWFPCCCWWACDCWLWALAWCGKFACREAPLGPGKVGLCPVLLLLTAEFEGGTHTFSFICCDWRNFFNKTSFISSFLSLCFNFLKFLSLSLTSSSESS